MPPLEEETLCLPLRRACGPEADADELIVRPAIRRPPATRAAMARGRLGLCLTSGLPELNIPKRQQRTLHALAQGATIRPVRDARGHIIDVDCVTGDGWRLADCDLAVFKALRRRGFITSRSGGPYRITREGLTNLRSQLDNRTTSRAW